MCLRYVETFNDQYTANFLLSMPAKEFWKSVNIWWSYDKLSSYFLLEHPV